MPRPPPRLWHSRSSQTQRASRAPRAAPARGSSGWARREHGGTRLPAATCCPPVSLQWRPLPFPSAHLSGDTTHRPGRCLRVVAPLLNIQNLWGFLWNAAASPALQEARVCVGAPPPPSLVAPLFLSPESPGRSPVCTLLLPQLTGDPTSWEAQPSSHLLSLPAFFTYSASTPSSAFPPWE